MSLVVMVCGRPCRPPPPTVAMPVICCHFVVNKVLCYVFQLHGELDELHRQLNSRRGAYGSSLSTVKLTAQAFKQFEKSADLIDGKVSGFSDTAERMMRDGRCDSRRLRREVDDVKRKWEEFHRAIAEYRNALDDSAKFFEQMDGVRHPFFSKKKQSL